MTLSSVNPSLLVKQLFDRETCTYTYLIIDPVTRQAALIDGVQEQFKRDMQIIEEFGVELLYAIETHVHADHVTSAGQIRQSTGAKIVYGKKAGIKAVDIDLEDGDRLSLGKYMIQAIATPGHTSACMSFFVDGMIFTGDTLLIRGCGRTDFQSGSPETLFESITSKIFKLPEETIVYPGHDYNGRVWSTVREEKLWNPRIDEKKSKEDFIEIMNNLNLALPNKINEAVPLNINCGVNYDQRRYVNTEYSMDDLYIVWKQSGEDILIIDNRTPAEFAEGHVPKCRNIPLGTEQDHVEELKKFKTVYFYCHSGRRAQTAFTNLHIVGLENLICISHSGMPDWFSANYPVEK